MTIFKDFPFEDGKPLTKSRLNNFYKKLKDHQGDIHHSGMHFEELYYMNLYIYQINENVLTDKAIHELAAIFRKIAKIEYPKYRN